MHNTFSFWLHINSMITNHLSDVILLVQFHIRVLESTQENISALLMGLEYLINISYVDETEVFKVWWFLISYLHRTIFLCFLTRDWIFELLNLFHDLYLPDTFMSRFAWIIGTLLFWSFLMRTTIWKILLWQQTWWDYRYAWFSLLI